MFLLLGGPFSETRTAADTVSPITESVSQVAGRTRFYLPSSGAAAVNPAFSTWTETTGADRLRTVVTRSASAMTSKTQAHTATAANSTFLSRMFVSDPIKAQVLPVGTVKGTIRVSESAANDNLNAMRLTVRVVSNDGSTFRSPNLYGPTNGTVAEFSTGLRAKRLATGGATASVTAQAGDRIVIEIGTTSTVGGTSLSDTVSYGDNSATDLPDNETATAADNPFLELNIPVVFAESLPRTTADTLGAISETAPTRSLTTARAASASVDPITEAVNQTINPPPPTQNFNRQADADISAITESTTSVSGLGRTTSAAIASILESVDHLLTFQRTTTAAVATLTEAAARDAQAKVRDAAETVGPISVAAGRQSSGPGVGQPRLDAAYVYTPSIDAGEIVAVLTELQGLGVDTVILSETREKSGGCSSNVYNWTNGNPDNIGLWLFEANQLGMGVYIGLVFSGGTCSIGHTEPNITQDRIDATNTVEYIVNTWGGSHPALRGWSIVNEPALAYHTDPTLQQQHYDYYGAQVAAVRAHSALPIVTAPYLFGVYAGTSWDGTFQSPAQVAAKAVAFRDNTGVDIQIWQTNIGGIAAFDWDRQSVYAADYFAALYDALGPEGLWVDVELFTQPSSFVGSGYAPGNMALIAHASAFPAGKRASFLQPYHMGVADDGHHPQTPRLLAAYKAWYGIEGTYIQPVSYTWNTPPEVGQPDTSNTKLFDLVTGDTTESHLGLGAAADHNWVGIATDPSVTIDMGVRYALHWVGAHVYNHTPAGVFFPDSMTIETSDNGSSWATQGTYPFPFGVKGEGDHVFINDSILEAVQCRYVRLSFVNPSPTRIGEIELIGAPAVASTFNRTVGDAIGAGAGFLMLLGTGEVFTESVTRGEVGTGRAVAQALGAISEAVSRLALAPLRSTDDALASLTETPTRLATLARSVPDSVATITEAVVRGAVAKLRAVADTIDAISEAPSFGANNVIRSTADTVGAVSETVARAVMDKARTAGDSIATLAESVARGATLFTRTGAEILGGITETITTGIVANVVRTVAETLGAVSETVTRVTDKVRISSDSVATVTEAVVRGTATVIRSTADTVGTITEAVGQAGANFIRTTSASLTSITESLVSGAGSLGRVGIRLKGIVTRIRSSGTVETQPPSGDVEE